MKVRHEFPGDAPPTLDWRGPFSMPKEAPPEVRRARVYQADVEDGHLTVIVQLEPGGWHLSVSHRGLTLDPRTLAPAPGRLPTFLELKDARYRFCPDDVTMAMIFPPSSEWVNVHPTTLHLHQIEGEITNG